MSYRIKQIFIQMSSNFLQRFKGKTQTISKDGVHNILGGGLGNQANIFTHSNGIQLNRKPSITKTTNNNIQKMITNQNSKKIQNITKKSVANQTKKSKQADNLYNKQKQYVSQNPFLISNPFYLDEEQRLRQQKQRKQLQKLKKMQDQGKKHKQDPKKGTYSTSMSSARRESVTKKGEKQWVKMGGLGPNLGGQQWQQKRKKQQKMQQFANQVKAINTSKIPTGKPAALTNKRQQKKDNPRTKALQYSKNVPKPIIKIYEKQEQQMESAPIKQINQNQLSQLQLYQLRHKQLKQMLKNQL